jgi:hypothetical protein
VEDYQMQYLLVDGKKKNPAHYEIERVRVRDEIGTDPRYAKLTVSLKPARQNRERGFGSSFAPREHCAVLTISFGELQQMLGGFMHELSICYQLLREKNLLPKLWEVKHEAPEPKKVPPIPGMPPVPGQGPRNRAASGVKRK